MLVDYNDHILCDLLEFGFPIGYTAGDIVDIKKPRNHSGARDFPDFILKYLKKELEYKAVIGPLKVNPFIYSSLVFVFDLIIFSVDLILPQLGHQVPFFLLILLRDC